MRHRSPGAAPLVCVAAILFALLAPPLARATSLTATSPPTGEVTNKDLDRILQASPIAAFRSGSAGAMAAADSADTSGIPFVESVRICAQNYCDIRGLRPICPTDSIEVRIYGHFPSNCYAVTKVEVVPWPSTGLSVPPPLVRLEVEDATCLTDPCLPVSVPFEARVTSWPMPPGDYQLGVQVVTVGCGDSLLRLAGPIASFPFTVSETCSLTPPPPQGCLLPGFTPPAPDGCNAYVDSSGSASLGVTVRSPVALAGLQGSLFFHGDAWAIVGLEAVGPAAGMHLSWARVENGIRYVLFADDGAPIPPTGPIETVMPPTVLSLKLATRGTPPPAIVIVGDMFGADADGNGVPQCPTMWDTRDHFAAIYARVCAEAVRCDANNDGLTDVRDLVRMVNCLHAPTCADSARFDCNQDHDFDLDDVICCARHILLPRECPDCPSDTTGRAAPHVRMTWNGAEETADGIEVYMTLEGAHSVGAGRWTLRAPLSSYEVIGIERVSGDAAWLPLIDTSADELAIGLVYLGEAGDVPAPQSVQLRLLLALRPGRTPGGSLDPIGQDFSGRDGALLIAGPSPEPMALPGTARLTLSENRPQPFRGATQFSVTLTEAMPLDLAVFDVGGRRVQVIHHGDLRAGTHAFAWNGRMSGGDRARSGIYFLRAASQGTVVTRRLVLLGGE